ncbi:MAG: hypothetical protein EPO07_19860, partial [Verrucomicrobia bacterium]
MPRKSFPYTKTEATPQARQFVANLTQLQVTDGVLTPVQAAVWKESLRGLIEQGAPAVPAIREFLEKNLDINFEGLENGSLMGASTLRSALLSAMMQIGGDEAVGTALEVLQTTADPAELALLAKKLDGSDASPYHDAILNAAREALHLAASGQWDGRDVGPLIDILVNYGGAASVGDLEIYANTWFNYTPLALAAMPDGTGIHSLIQLAENNGGSVTLGRDMYQRALAQSAQQYPEAADALLQLLQRGRIDVSAWPGIAAALGGATLQIQSAPISGKPATSTDAAQKTYHVAIGNQNYYELPPGGTMTAEEVQSRISLIDRLLAATSNPAA